ncbi:MAG: type II and III secretion system protein, partial [Candidatus Omnitrophica bacterium]|nr:type II and III secretion system protein [Candidatus Omnitrophota bacterium]
LTVIGATLALDFLTTQSDTKYLARPRILTLSNETAEIKISAQEAIGESSVTSSSEGTATTTQEAERYETGVIMRVTPQVNLDTGEITMYIDPKVVDVKQGGTFGGVTYNDPETRGTKSVVRVQDGETIVLGGLLRKRTNQTLIKVPFLGDIPLIGALFRHKSKTRDEDRELIVFITPRLIQESLPMRTLVAVKELEREQEIPPLPSRTIVINQALADIERKKR